MQFTAEYNRKMPELMSQVEDSVDSTGFVRIDGLMVGEDYLYPEDVWAVVYPDYEEFYVFAEEGVQRTNRFLDRAECPER